ncbi:MAG: hypothetical protein QXF61_06240 [Nitrososphaeria archaeon]
MSDCIFQLFNALIGIVGANFSLEAPVDSPLNLVKVRSITWK